MKFAAPPMLPATMFEIVGDRLNQAEDRPGHDTGAVGQPEDADPVQVRLECEVVRAAAPGKPGTG